MKKTFKMMSFAFALSILLSSCYSYTTVVGKGAQGGASVSKWNHYLIGGLAPIGVTNPQDLAGDTQDYTVKTEMSFVNGLVSAITFGLYAPTTTTVTK